MRRHFEHTIVQKQRDQKQSAYTTSVHSPRALDWSTLLQNNGIEAELGPPADSSYLRLNFPKLRSYCLWSLYFSFPAPSPSRRFLSKEIVINRSLFTCTCILKSLSELI